MTPSEALIHPWIMEGLNSQLAIEHLKNLGLDKQQIENKTKTSRNNQNFILLEFAFFLNRSIHCFVKILL